MLLFYCSSVRDLPVSSTNSEILKKTQHFALTMCPHKWDSDYSFPLSSTFNLPSLSTRHSISKLSSLKNYWQPPLLPSGTFIHKSIQSHASRYFNPPTFSIPFSCHLLHKTHLSLSFSLCGINFLIMWSVAPLWLLLNLK